MNVIAENFAVALGSTLSEALISTFIKILVLEDTKANTTHLSTFSASRHVVIKWVVGLCVKKVCVSGGCGKARMLIDRFTQDSASYIKLYVAVLTFPFVD